MIRIEYKRLSSPEDRPSLNRIVFTFVPDTDAPYPYPDMRSMYEIVMSREKTHILESEFETKTPLELFDWLTESHRHFWRHGLGQKTPYPNRQAWLRDYLVEHSKDGLKYRIDAMRKKLATLEKELAEMERRK